MENGSGPNRHGNRKEIRPGVTPTSEEKRLLDVCVTVKIDRGEGVIEGAIGIQQGTTIADLLVRILSEYRDAFTQDWQHVIFSKWNERFQCALPIPASEYAQKQCEDGARYEAFFFAQDVFTKAVDGSPRSLPTKGVVDFGDEDDDESPPSQSPQGQDSPTLKHKRYWYPVNVLADQPKTKRLQYDDRRSQGQQTANYSNILQGQEAKNEEDDAGSNVADSRLGASIHTTSRQEEGSGPVAPGARSVVVKQDVDDAANAFPLGATVSLLEVKHEADGVGSNVTDSRLGAPINIPTCREEGNATAPGARNADVKQEAVETDVPRNDIDRLAEEIVHEGAKLEDAYVYDGELDNALSVPTPSIIEPVASEASANCPFGRETRVVRLRSGTEVPLVPRRSTPPSSAKEPASLFARTRKRREKKKIETRKVRQMKLLKKRTAEAEAQTEAKEEPVSEMDVEAEAEAEAAGGKDGSGAAATQWITNSKSTKRTALVRKLQRKEATIRRLETDLQDESRVPAWRVEQRSVGSWRAKRTASLQKAKQEYDEVQAELKVTEGVLVLYRAARRWYIDHGKSREFFKKLRRDGYDRLEKIIRHFWKDVSHVDRNVLFELCVTESPFVFESDLHKLEAWREAFASEEAFNDYFHHVFFLRRHVTGTASNFVILLD
ncbi:hypothetical protein AAVH_09103 [Aphelenchoides avenae]|nr:hypothetical protein AAVH_09103 [Aphelenchus avenae]